MLTWLITTININGSLKKEIAFETNFLSVSIDVSIIN